VIPVDGSADVLAPPPLSLTYPSVAVTASLTNWSRMDHLFDLPALPRFRLPTHALVLDAFGGMLECFAVGGFARGAIVRSRRVHPPCTSDPLFPASVPPVLPIYTSQPSEIRADNDYRTFRPSRSIFDQSLFPDEVPSANRALEKWIVGLFR
jgi:hypothetical protein